MPRHLLIALVTLAAALTVVPDALAKGPVTSLEVCGADTESGAPSDLQ